MTPSELRRRRKAAGYRLRAAAARCRVPERTWGSWERGEYPIPEHAETLLEVLENQQDVNLASTPPDKIQD